VDIFPNVKATIRLVGAIRIEQDSPVGSPKCEAGTLHPAPKTGEMDT
jgi:hypothetical protein